MYWTGQWYVPWKIVIEVVSKAFDAIKEPFFITVVDGATKTVATTEDALAMTVTMARPILWSPTATFASAAAGVASSSALVAAPPPAPESPEKRLRDELDAALLEIKHLRGEVPQE